LRRTTHRVVDGGGKEAVVNSLDELVRAVMDFAKEGATLQRYKGLGEMNPAQLRETTMDPKTRALVRITLPQDYQDRDRVRILVDELMGRNPEHRFQFIQSNAARIDEEAIDA